MPQHTTGGRKLKKRSFLVNQKMRNVSRDVNNSTYPTNCSVDRVWIEELVVIYKVPSSHTSWHQFPQTGSDLGHPIYRYLHFNRPNSKARLQAPTNHLLNGYQFTLETSITSSFSNFSLWSGVFPVTTIKQFVTENKFHRVSRRTFLVQRNLQKRCLTSNFAHDAWPKELFCETTVILGIFELISPMVCHRGKIIYFFRPWAK